jgi:hypothetical protein
MLKQGKGVKEIFHPPLLFALDYMRIGFETIAKQMGILLI